MEMQDFKTEEARSTRINVLWVYTQNPLILSERVQWPSRITFCTLICIRNDKTIEKVMHDGH